MAKIIKSKWVVFCKNGHLRTPGNTEFATDRQGREYPRCIICRRLTGKRRHQRNGPQRVAANKEYRKLNRVLLSEKARIDRRDNPEKYRIRQLRRNKGISEIEFEAKLSSQGRRCAICRTDKWGGPIRNGPVMDHDHKCCNKQRGCCGRCNRGILCYKCNGMLGMANDDIDRLKAAIRYLRKYELSLAPREVA